MAQLTLYFHGLIYCIWMNLKLNFQVFRCQLMCCLAWFRVLKVNSTYYNRNPKIKVLSDLQRQRKILKKLVIKMLNTMQKQCKEVHEVVSGQELLFWICAAQRIKVKENIYKTFWCSRFHGSEVRAGRLGRFHSE